MGDDQQDVRREEQDDSGNHRSRPAIVRKETPPGLIHHSASSTPHDGGGSGDGSSLQVLYQRRKTTVERLYGTVSYDTEKGSFLIHVPIATLWKWILCLTVAVMIIGFGTCVVGANVEFSGGMKHYFFVVALLVSLVLSTLFSWLVWVLGGAMRDVTTSFVSISALSLVVLQVRTLCMSSGLHIGLLPLLMLTALRTQVAQTHLIAQQQEAL